MRFRAPDPENVPLRDSIHEQKWQRGRSYAAFARPVGADGSAVSSWIRDSKPTPAMTYQIA